MGLYKKNLTFIIVESYKETDAEKIFKETMAENFLNFVRNINLYI